MHTHIISFFCYLRYQDLVTPHAISERKNIIISISPRCNRQHLALAKILWCNYKDSIYPLWYVSCHLSFDCWTIRYVIPCKFHRLYTKQNDNQGTISLLCYFELGVYVNTLPQNWVDPKAILHLVPLQLFHFATDSRHFHMSSKSLRGGKHVNYT